MELVQSLVQVRRVAGHPWLCDNTVLLTLDPMHTSLASKAHVHDSRTRQLLQSAGGPRIMLLALWAVACQLDSCNCCLIVRVDESVPDFAG